jgi:hypothetical protein
MAEHTVENDARREIEDLWWLRDSLESLLGERPDGDMIRVGVLRGLLGTTAPETTTTHPSAVAPCDPPCSLACMVTKGAHHTAESLREAATAEIDECVLPPGRGGA